jgi:hypothetical protein
MIIISDSENQDFISLVQYSDLNLSGRNGVEHSFYEVLRSVKPDAGIKNK